MIKFIHRFTCKVGDSVQADENVMEIETDKTTVGVPTPVTGVIEEIFVQDGDTVKAGQNLFKIKPGAAGAKPAAPQAVSKPAEPTLASTLPPQAAAPIPVPTPAAAATQKPAAASPPPPAPPKPIAPASTIPVAAIRHAQAVEASVKVSFFQLVFSYENVELPNRFSNVSRWNNKKRVEHYIEIVNISFRFHQPTIQEK